MLDLSGHLLDVMKDIRDMAAGDVDDVAPRPSVRAVAWKAEEPVKLAGEAHAIAQFLHAHHDVEKAIHLDKRTRTTSLTSPTPSPPHTRITRAFSPIFAARRTLVSSLQARAHHIRVKARLAHRHDAGKMTAFASPVAHHAVHHRAPAVAPPAS